MSLLVFINDLKKNFGKKLLSVNYFVERIIVKRESEKEMLSRQVMALLVCMLGRSVDVKSVLRQKVKEIRSID